MSEPFYYLFVDDSGSRFIDRPSTPRHDGLDHFAMGGILIKEEDVAEVERQVEAVRSKHSIIEPFHSTKMRSRKKGWSWLGVASEEERATALIADLTAFLCAMSCRATACVIHRPGYEARYSGIAREERWQLCKSAYAILAERAAKLAARDGRRLAIYVEQTGKREDNDIRNYHRTLREKGMIFNQTTSGKYQPLLAEHLSETLSENPRFFNKSSLLGQVADLVLYPLVKGRYDLDYLPYRSLMQAGRIIDSILSLDEVHLGVKYYCFDGL